MCGGVVFMPRRRRIWYPGAIYHVMSRGNRRSAIFGEERDYLDFLWTLSRVREKYPFIIHSICLMTNHFHMCLETMEDEVWVIMQKVLGTYAREYNYRNGLTGHLFEGRYTAQIIQEEPYFLEVSRYIHLNPVKAQMVRSPIDYEYSSYRLFVPERIAAGRPVGSKAGVLIERLVETDRILDFFGDNCKEQYRQFVEGKIRHEEQERLIQKEMKEDNNWLPL